jgi:VanZ family protein
VAGCVLAWSSAFVVTHLPGGHLPPLPGGDKIAHGVGYAALTALTLLALRGMGVRRRRRLVFLLVAVPIYAGLDELTQILVNRHCCLGDWLADVIGAAIAVGFFELIGISPTAPASRRRPEPAGAHPAFGSARS